MIFGFLMTCRPNSTEGGRHVDTRTTGNDECDVACALARMAGGRGFDGRGCAARRIRCGCGVSVAASAAPHGPVDRGRRHAGGEESSDGEDAQDGGTICPSRDKGYAAGIGIADTATSADERSACGA